MKKLSLILVAGSLALFSCKQSTEQKEDNSSATEQKQKEENEKTSVGVSKDGVTVESEQGDNKTNVTISKDTAGITIEKPPK